MNAHFAHRHFEKDVRILMIFARQAITIENVVVHHASGLGRKKLRNRYAHEFQSRGSMRSSSGVRIPHKAVIIRVILRSSIRISPAPSMRTGLPQRLMSPPVGSRKTSSRTSSFLLL